MIAKIRRWILIYILILVVGTTWLTRHRVASWDDSLWVSVHPINADGSAASAEHIAALDRDSFAALDAFFADEAARHGLVLSTPVHIVLGDPIQGSPPAPPADPSTLAIMLWSLQLRWWVWRVDKGDDPPPADVQLFVRYFDPETAPVLQHSLGLREGMIGVVNAFASERDAGGNRVIIAHEIMHTLGAADRYEPGSNLPSWPDGYAEPDRDPLYPQEFAELMGGRIPQDQTSATIPRTLDLVVIGEMSAREIGWRKYLCTEVPGV